MEAPDPALARGQWQTKGTRTIRGTESPSAAPAPCPTGLARPHFKTESRSLKGAGLCAVRRGSALDKK